MPGDLDAQPAEDELPSRDRAPAAPASPFVPFAQPIFRAVWFATLSSNFGGLIQAVAAAWLMTTISGSPDMVALVQASNTLPVMLFSLAAGAISDNYDRRVIMLIAQGFMFAASTALARARLARPARAVAAADLHVPDRLRHRAEQSGLAGLGRRHGAARRHSGRHHAQQRQLQPRAQRRAGARRR